MNVNINEITLGTVASIDVPYKGQSDVIRAISLLRNDSCHFKYKIVGQGNPSFLRKVILQNNAADYVEIVGPLPSAHVSHFMDEIDVYIQPSKTEGLPRALIEAMSRACPSFGANTGGIPELLSEECIFEPGNVAQIVSMLKQINAPLMHAQAITNFSNSKNYQKETLEVIRGDFYESFSLDNCLD